MTKKNSFKVVVVVKEMKGNHAGVVDKFAGSPEKVICFLNDKYVGKKGSVFDWLAEPFNVVDREMRRLHKR